MFFIVLGKVCQGLKPIRKGRFFSFTTHQAILPFITFLLFVC